MKLHRDTLRMDPADAERLRQAGLGRVDEVLRCIGDQVVAWSRSTDTVRVDVPDMPDMPGRAVYLKRYHHLSWRRRIKGMLRGTFLGLSRARAEFEQLVRLRSAGAPAVRPIAYGERRVLRFVRSCFLITEGVPDAVSLTTFAQGGDGFDGPARRELARALGRCVADLHRGGVVHGALFGRNVLVRRAQRGGFAFVLLDAAGRRAWRALRERWGHGTASGVRDLAQLAASAMELSTRTERMRFALAYFGVRRLDASQKRIVREIAERAGPLRRHEEYRARMDRMFHYHLVCE